MNSTDLKNTCSYVASELNRIQTVAGTLAMIEQEHYTRLTSIGNRDLLDIAVEEQSASRQLGMVKQVCVELAQRVEELQSAIERGELQGVADLAPAH